VYSAKDACQAAIYRAATVENVRQSMIMEGILSVGNEQFTTNWT
jgi:hypothetical protein